MRRPGSGVTGGGPKAPDYAQAKDDRTDNETLDDELTGTGDDSQFARRLEHYTAIGGDPTDPASRRGAAELLAGRYRILKLIGRGSMGRIYLAEQIAVGRKVAIKIINREFTAKFDTVARFQQEARLLASVQNPHVVDVYDIGETDGRDPFIVMEYLDGPSLATEIKDHAPLDPVRTVRLLLQVASALATVHEAGVVHRDLKPANIVLIRAGARKAEVVKILDFGLAKVVRDREAAGRLTRAGVIIGTPEYMSPEQINGQKVDHRADLYSLGCTAYEMLTGQPPFTGAEMSTLYKHLHEEVPPIRVAAPKSNVPEALDRVILKALAKEPDQRYPDAESFRRALLDAADAAGIPRAALRVETSVFDEPKSSEASISKTGILAAPPPGLLAPAVAPRPRRIEVGLLIATALVLGLVGGVWVGRQRGAPPAAPAAAGTVVPPAAAAGAAGAPAKAALVVNSKPAGASCSIDGGKAKPAPVAWKQLAPGKHHLKLERRGYAPLELDVELAAGEVKLVELALEHPKYEARIETAPPGATVTVDAVELGATPLTTELTEGEFHEIAIRREGYRPRTLFLDPTMKQPLVQVTLEPALLQYGSLFIDSESPGRVLLNDTDTGEWTPTGELQLKPGRYKITLVDNVGAQRTVTAKVVLGDVTVVTVPP